MKEWIYSILKFNLILFVIICFCFSSLLTIPLQITFPFVGMKLINGFTQYYSKLALIILKVKINLTQDREICADDTYLIFSNHLSYLDILIISSVIPSSFVTSLDMKAVPFLGHLTQLAGCLYVNRRTRKNIKHELSEIKRTLEEGINVTFFPEGTSSNHEKVLKFKRSLFESIEDTPAKLLPLTLNYTTINQQKINLVSRDWVCWYGDMSFVSHLWSLVKCHEVNALLHIHSAFLPKTKDTAILRDLSFQMIIQKFQPVN